MKRRGFLETPDGRYIVVRGRLWQKTNPNLSEDERKRLVAKLMTARGAVKEAAGDLERIRKAGDAVDMAKIGLGEPAPMRARCSTNLRAYLAR